MENRASDQDSLSCFLERLEITRRETGKFQHQLSDYPHTFQLPLEDSLGDNFQRKLITGLQSALSVGYQTRLETARARNFLAYLHHLRHDDKAALRELESVLALPGQQQNLVTLSNKACILHSSFQLSDADEVVETLKRLKESGTLFEDLVVLAKAELAFTYTRLGPSKGHLAIEIFNEVIPKAKDSEVAWLWKFGLALTHRRALRADPQMQSLNPAATSKESNLLNLLLDIAQNATSDSLRAKAYAELAVMLHMVSRSSLCMDFKQREHISPETACRKAMQLDGNDNSVLCKCGKIFRYLQKPKISLELLEKALSKRPSSTGFHHLGLTYKYLATNDKYKRGAFRYNQQSRTNYSDAARSFGRPESERNRRHNTFYNQSAASPAEYAHGPQASALEAKRNLSTKGEIRAIQKVVKSPCKGVTKFSREDPYIEKAMENLKKAIEYSNGTNTRATYDLAILQKSLGELEEARRNLLDILNYPKTMFVSEIINVYEQIGLIFREMSEAEEDEEKKNKLLKDGNNMLHQALKYASEICSTSPILREHIGEIWNSFSELWKNAEQTSSSTHSKLKEKAMLLQLIKNHKQSLDLLKELDEIDPAHARDLEHLKLMIEGYVETNQFEKALTFVELLRCTSETKTILELFSDKHYLSKVYLKAARQALMDGSHNAKLHFQTVFTEIVSNVREATSGSEDTDATSEDGQTDPYDKWDITILHEKEKEERDKAATLAKLLTSCCGLRFPVLDEDVPVGRIECESVLRIMRRSSMVVVLAGARPKVSAYLRWLISHATDRPSTVTLLSGGNCAPEMLKKSHRSMECPSLVLEAVSNTAFSIPTSSTEEEIPPGVKLGIFEIFCFLVNLRTSEEHIPD